MSSPSQEVIRVLPGLTAVRRRPELYLPETTDLGLLLACLSAMAQPCRDSQATAIEVHLLVGSGFRLTCDTCAMPTGTSNAHGIEQPTLLTPLLVLLAPGPEGFPGVAPILNALTEYMRISVVGSGLRLTVETSRGGLLTPVRAEPTRSSVRTCVELIPDREVVQAVQVTPALLLERFASLQEDARPWPTFTCEYVDEELNAYPI